MRSKAVLCLIAVLMVWSAYAGPVFADGIPIHNGTLFSSGEALAPVPQGVLRDYGGQIYVDVGHFFELFGYRIHRYSHSDLWLMVKENHRVLFAAGTRSYNQIGDFASFEPIRDEWKVSGEEHPSKVGRDGELGVAPFVLYDRMFLPLQDFLSVIGISYVFDNYGRIEIPSIAFLPGYHTTKEELRDFARIIYYETRDSSLHKKTAVGGVIMNRVHSPDWPNTVHDVIYARNQFPPVRYSGFSALEPPAVQYEGAVHSLNGVNAAPGCFFFNLAPFPGKEADFYQLIEGDYFYR